MRGHLHSVVAAPAHVRSMNSFLAASSQFDPDAITPAHIVAAIVLNLLWAALTIRDHRRRVRAERQQNPE